MSYKVYDKRLVNLYSSVLEVTHCPYCNSQKFYRHGRYKYTERYRCCSCKRTFIPSTGTSIHYLKKKVVFIEYAEDIKNRGLDTLRAMCKRLKIAPLTAFDWRHKILASLSPEEFTFGREVICDDLWLRFSRKGRKGVDNPRKHGGKITPADDKNCSKTVSSTDETASMFRLATVGKLREKHLLKVLCGRIEPESKIISSSRNCYLGFVKKMSLNHEDLKFVKKTKKAIKINRFIGMNKDLKLWINHKLCGVSTKYLQQYNNFYLFSLFRRFDPLGKYSLNLRFVWRIFTDMENIYRNFITQQTTAVYSAPTKRKWKTTYNYYISINNIPY